MRLSRLVLLCAITAIPAAAFVLPQQGARLTRQALRSHNENDVEIFSSATTTTLSLENATTVSLLDSASQKLTELSANENRDAINPNAVWRKRWHNWMRDSGGVRLFMDTATRLIAAPQFYQEHPQCFPDFVRISGDEYAWLSKALRMVGMIPKDQPCVQFSKECYGDHPLQVAQVMVNVNSTMDTNDTMLGQQPPLFFFVHGGAWGSGFPTMYRLMSVPFLQRGFRAVILGYRTYPDGKVEDQVDDIVKAIDYFGTKYGSGIGGDKPPTVLMGHSSGAHISLLAALQGRIPSVDAIIAASGVYDCLAQVEHERSLNIDQLSPLSPAAGMTKERMQANSPSWIVSQSNKGEIEAIPPVLLVHGNDDAVVLPSSSIEFFEQLKDNGVSTQPDLRVLDGIGHQDPVVDTLVGGKTQSVIFEWLEEVVTKIR